MGRPRKTSKKTPYSADKLELFKLGGSSSTMLKNSQLKVPEEKITSNQQLTDKILKCMNVPVTQQFPAAGKKGSDLLGSLKTTLRRRKDSTDKCYEVVHENNSNNKQSMAEKKFKTDETSQKKSSNNSDQCYNENKNNQEDDKPLKKYNSLPIPTNINTTQSSLLTEPLIKFPESSTELNNNCSKINIKKISHSPKRSIHGKHLFDIGRIINRRKTMNDCESSCKEKKEGEKIYSQTAPIPSYDNVITKNYNKVANKKELISKDLEPDKIVKALSNDQIYKQNPNDILDHVTIKPIETNTNDSDQCSVNPNKSENNCSTTIININDNGGPTKNQVLASVFARKIDKIKPNVNNMSSKPYQEEFLETKTNIEESSNSNRIIVNIQSPSDLNDFRSKLQDNSFLKTKIELNHNETIEESSKNINLNIIENPVRKSVIVDPTNNDKLGNLEDVMKKNNLDKLVNHSNTKITNIDLTNKADNINKNAAQECVNKLRNPFRYLRPEMPNSGPVPDILIRGNNSQSNLHTTSNNSHFKSEAECLINIFFTEADIKEFSKIDNIDYCILEGSCNNISIIFKNCKILQCCSDIVIHLYNTTNSLDIKDMCKNILFIMYDCFTALLPKIPSDQINITEAVVMWINKIILLFPIIEYNKSCLNLSYVLSKNNPFLWTQIIICTNYSKYYFTKININDIVLWMNYLPKYTFCFTLKYNYNQCIVVQKLPYSNIFIEYFNIRNSDEIKKETQIDAINKLRNCNNFQHITNSKQDTENINFNNYSQPISVLPQKPQTNIHQKIPFELNQHNFQGSVPTTSNNSTYYDDISANFQRELSNIIRNNQKIITDDNGKSMHNVLLDRENTHHPLPETHTGNTSLQTQRSLQEESQLQHNSAEQASVQRQIIQPTPPIPVLSQILDYSKNKNPPNSAYNDESKNVEEPLRCKPTSGSNTQTILNPLQSTTRKRNATGEFHTPPKKGRKINEIKNKIFETPVICHKPTSIDKYNNTITNMNNTTTPLPKDKVDTMKNSSEKLQISPSSSSVQFNINNILGVTKPITTSMTKTNPNIIDLNDKTFVTDKINKVNSEGILNLSQNTKSLNFPVTKNTVERNIIDLNDKTFVADKINKVNDEGILNLSKKTKSQNSPVTENTIERNIIDLNDKTFVTDKINKVNDKGILNLSQNKKSQNSSVTENTVERNIIDLNNKIFVKDKINKVKDERILNISQTTKSQNPPVTENMAERNIIRPWLSNESEKLPTLRRISKDFSFRPTNVTEIHPPLSDSNKILHDNTEVLQNKIIDINKKVAEKKIETPIKKTEDIEYNSITEDNTECKYNIKNDPLKEFSTALVNVLKDFINDSPYFKQLYYPNYGNYDVKTSNEYFIKMFQKDLEMLGNGKKHSDKANEMKHILQSYLGPEFPRIMSTIINSERLKNCKIKEEVIELDDDTFANFKSIAQRFKGKPLKINENYLERHFNQHENYIPQKDILDSEAEKYQIAVPADNSILGKEYDTTKPETDRKSVTTIDSAIVVSDDEEHSSVFDKRNLENNKQTNSVSDNENTVHNISTYKSNLNELQNMDHDCESIRTGSVNSDHTHYSSETLNSESYDSMFSTIKSTNNTSETSPNINLTSDNNMLFLTPDMIKKINKIIPKGKLAYIRSQNQLIRYFDNSEIEAFSKTVSSNVFCNETNRESIQLPEYVIFSSEHTLDVSSYVSESEKVLKYVPKDFMCYYNYITRFQIVNGNSPISFNTFLDMHNTKKIIPLFHKYIKYLQKKALSNELDEFM